ncbi:TonB-dependent receptor [Luteolibacter marinus]|uniref:TonB-dependent receptor n=1 Tax=Luteolibacter marinus TaxID=2776705 RepID=UPI00186609A3|nr:TonB-dependent receptor [Luteolibacter marinus]
MSTTLGPLCSASFAFAFSGALLAQDADLLDPTIVEAERVEDELSAVSVISRDSLELFQARSFSDLTGLVPGFNIVSADSRGFGQVVAMRGSTNTLFFGPPALGLYVDDVPLGDAYSYPSELLELSEVRVHRGPQGPYFGRNGAAGMVEMFTPRPGDENVTQLTAEYGSYDHVGLGLLTSGPLGGDFSYSLQLFHDQRDGYVRNAFYGTELDDREASGGLLNLYWNPCDDFELRLRFYAETINDGSQRLTSLFSPDPFTDSSDFPGATDLERYQTSIHSRKDLDWGKIETISSYQTWDLDPSTVDLDLTFANPFNGFADSRSTITQHQDLISNELRFSSNDDATPVSWRAGLFQMWIENEGLASRQFPVFFPVAATIIEDTNFSIEQLNLAAYGNFTWHATDRMAVDAGLRVDYHESEIDRVMRTTTVPNFGIPNTTVRGGQDEWFVSPALGVTYGVTDAVDVFVRSSIGNKPSGYSAYADTLALAAFDREQNWSNEIGIQYDCPAYDLRVGLRGFWDQIDDYQFNESVPNSTNFVIVNADEVTSRGVELDLAWTPTDHLTVRGSFGYVDAEFDSYQSPFNPATYYNGRKVPFVPEYTGSAGIRYDFDCGFYAQTSVRVSGPTRYDAANTTTFTQDAYFNWDAEIGYNWENFSIALYGRNLLDEEYYTFVNPQVFAGAPGDPQIFGLRVRTMF